MKKILLTMIMVILMVSVVTAFEFDNIKEYEKVGKYGKIKIKNAFGLGDDLIDLELTENTEQCSDDCYAIKEIDLWKKGVLASEVKFISMRTGLEINIRNYDFYLLQDGNRVPYELGTELEEGHYTLKLEGEKRGDQEVDWIIKSQGEWLNEWAVWGGVTRYDTFDDWSLDTTKFNFWYDGDCTTGQNWNETGGQANASCVTNAPQSDTIALQFENNGYDWNSDNFTIQFTTDFGGDPNRGLCLGWVNKDESNGNCYDDGDNTELTEADLTASVVSWIPNTTTIGVFLDGTWQYNLAFNYTGLPSLTMSEGGSANPKLHILEVNSSANYVTLVNPMDNAGSTALQVEFNCSANVENATITNISLWTNSSGSWTEEASKTGLSGNFEGALLNDTFADNANYLWTCRACDSDGDCGFATTNRTISIDSTAPIINITYPQGNVGVRESGNMTLNWTYVEPNPSSCWYQYNYTNVTINCSSYGVTFETTNVTNIMACIQDTSNTITCDENDFDWDIRFKIYDVNNNEVTNPRVKIDSLGINSIGNPFTQSRSSLIGNNISSTYSINLTDYDDLLLGGLHTREIIPQNASYNFTMSAKQLSLYFYHNNNTFAQVNGTVDDLVDLTQFQSNNFTSILTNLAQKRVEVTFAWNQSRTNYTQFYEYDNDWITIPNINLTVLEISDLNSVSTNVKVTGDDGNLIENAIVQLYYADMSADDDYELVGQRYTNVEGRTFFFTKRNAKYFVNVIKDGYNPIEQRCDITLFGYSEENPCEVKLEKSITGFNNSILFMAPSWFTNRTGDINFSIYAPGRGNMKFNTVYGESQGTGNRTIDVNKYQFGINYLDSGSHFETTGTNDIIVRLWSEGELVNTYTINFRVVDSNLLEEISGLDQTTKTRLIFIALILLSGIGGLLIKFEDFDNVGTNIFMGGGIILGLIFFNLFSWFFVVCMISLVLKIMRSLTLDA